MKASSFRLISLVTPVLIMLFFACATPQDLYGKCTKGACPTSGPNAQPEGSICNEVELCQCPDGMHKCCPVVGGFGKCQAEACPEEFECPNRGDAGTDSGAPTAECSVDLNCQQPIDKECGRGTCVDGTCKLEIHVGPTPSQLYGDCMRR